MSLDMTEPERMKRNLQMTFALHEAGILMMKQNLLRRHPEATDAEREEMFRAWLQDAPLLGVPFDQLDKPGRTAG
jgi:hypothetical protein